MTWTLHHGDCLDPVRGLAILADRSIDHVICDPPYSEHTHASFHLQRSDGGPSRADGPGFSAMNVFPAAEVARLCRRWAIVFCDTRHQEMICSGLESSGMFVARVMAWVKPNGPPQFSGDRPAQGYEPIVVAHQAGKMRWNSGGKRGVYSSLVEMENRSHPTQKPLALMRELVADFTDPGETILDPFAGSGTTGVACNQLGRHFVGWERDANYHAIATRRLNGDEAKPNPRQPSLFDDTERTPTR